MIQATAPFYIYGMKNIVLPIFAVLLACAAYAQALDAKLQSIFEDHHLMGMSVVKICQGQVGFSKGYGWADYDDQRPVTDSTIYRIASISKAVTAAALMTLYDQGLFGLDDDIGTALGYPLRHPVFPNVPITSRMLLAHTSSIRDGVSYAEFLGATYSEHPPPVSDYFVPGGEYYTSSVFGNKKPGTYFTYSNANFGLLATLIEKLSGQRFDVYCREKIFAPLGMQASFNPADLPNPCHVAALYRFQNGQWMAQADEFDCQPLVSLDLSGYLVGTNGFVFAPQGGLRTSANDLAKFGLMHLQNGTFGSATILAPATAALMRSPQWQYNGSNGNDYYGLFKSWGLGLHLTTNVDGADIVFPNHPMIGHPGEAYGLISDLYFDTLGNGVIFITNGSKNGYATVPGSAFYPVEAAAFAAVFDDLTDCAVTGSSNLLPTNGLQVFPNPVGDWLWVRTGVDWEGQEVSGTLLDMTGRLVVKRTWRGSAVAAEWPLSGLAQGWYLLRVGLEVRRVWKGE